MITDVNKINTETEEGKLLLAAIAKITTESQTDKTPDQVIEQLQELSSGMSFSYMFSTKQNGILVIDIETTGFLNRGGKIVEIGLVDLNLKTGDKKIIFDKVINPEIPRDEIEKSWIVTEGYMNTDDILDGVTFSSIKEDLQQIINSYQNGATAFNSQFDFGFLESEGYKIEFPKKLPCPMKKSTPICKLPNQNGYAGYKWPKVEEAYKHFYPESDYVELHRGADDAFHEADIVFALHQLGEFLE